MGGEEAPPTKRGVEWLSGPVLGRQEYALQYRGECGSVWVVGSSPTVVFCVGALELGSPFPSTDSELHKCESVRPYEAARYPARL